MSTEREEFLARLAHSAKLSVEELRHELDQPDAPPADTSTEQGRTRRKLEKAAGLPAGSLDQAESGGQAETVAENEASGIYDTGDGRHFVAINVALIPIGGRS